MGMGMGDIIYQREAVFFEACRGCSRVDLAIIHLERDVNKALQLYNVWSVGG